MIINIICVLIYPKSIIKVTQIINNGQKQLFGYLFGLDIQKKCTLILFMVVGTWLILHS